MHAKLAIRIGFLLLVGGLQACSSGADREITITDSEDTYEFYAQFERHKTRQVQDLLKTRITPASSLTQEPVAIRATLDNKTHIDLEASPGIVRIKLDKEASSEASYRRVKTLCADIRKVLDKQ